MMVEAQLWLATVFVSGSAIQETAIEQISPSGFKA